MATCPQRHGDDASLWLQSKNDIEGRREGALEYQSRNVGWKRYVFEIGCVRAAEDDRHAGKDRVAIPHQKTERGPWWEAPACFGSAGVWMIGIVIFISGIWRLGMEVRRALATQMDPTTS